MSRRAPIRRRGLPQTAGVAVMADKRFRRSDVRQGRRRRLSAFGWRIGAFALAAVLVVGGGAWLVRAFIESRLFAVGHIVVRGNTRLSTGQVEALVDGIRGESVWLVDFEHYRKRIMDSAWVADVSLWRVLPSTVEVRVVERVPLAIARRGQQLYLVDRGGVIIAEYDAQYRSFDLPVVDGLVASPAGGTAMIDGARAALARSCLDALRTIPDLRDRISQVDVSNARDAVVVLNAETTFLHLGDDRFVERLYKYLDLVPTLRDRFPEIDYVDLRFDDRVFVRPAGKTAVQTVKKRGNW